jgi:hypothetical protein
MQEIMELTGVQKKDDPASQSFLYSAGLFTYLVFVRDFIYHWQIWLFVCVIKEVSVTLLVIHTYLFVDPT